MNDKGSHEDIEEVIQPVVFFQSEKKFPDATKPGKRGRKKGSKTKANESIATTTSKGFSLSDDQEKSNNILDASTRINPIELKFSIDY